MTMSERSRLLLSISCGVAAATLSASAFAGVVGAINISDWQALTLHLTAVAACYVAARLRTQLSSVEFDLVLMTAIFIPGFGPALAWLFPRSDGSEEAQNAHALFEDFVLVLESVALTANLPQAATPEIVERFAQLRSAESGIFGP